MFDTKKTLIVVYKDELLMNQLKKLVETHDDRENEVVGTIDDSINIVSWTEKVWLDNKTPGNIKGKILFLGDIKGTDELTPVIDIKFDDCGVRYGWAGSQAIVYANVKELTARSDYDAFLEKLSSLPVPKFLKETKDNITATGEDTKPNESDAKSSGHDENGIFKLAKNVIETGVDVISKVGEEIAAKTEEVFRDKTLMERQMLFYGVINLYNDRLQEFMDE